MGGAFQGKTHGSISDDANLAPADMLPITPPPDQAIGRGIEQEKSPGGVSI